MMAVDRYIWHITLQTGQTRKSWRHEIDPAVLPIVGEILEAALAAGAQEPTIAEMDAHPLGIIRTAPLPVRGYNMSATAEGRCLVATVYAGGDDPLLSFGVAAHARCGAGLWRCLTEIPEPLNPMPDRPQTPWCAAKLLPGIRMHPHAAAWLGDLQRCMAWAWLERQP